MQVPRWVIAVTGAVLAVLTFQGVAFAGGSWIAPDRSAYVPAEIAVFEGEFSTGSLEGTISDAPYIAYLLPLDRWIADHVVPVSAIRLGELSIVRTSSHGFHARVAFEVPDVSTGMYHVQYCNEPCTVDGIGDLIGSESFAIGATHAEGRLLILNQRLRWKAQEAVARADQKVLTVSERYQEALDEQANQLSTAEARVSELAGDLATTRRALRTERSTAWGPIAGALLVACLALLAAFTVMVRRLRRARLDAELHALTHDELVRME